MSASNCPELVVPSTTPSKRRRKHFRRRKSTPRSASPQPSWKVVLTSRISIVAALGLSMLALVVLANVSFENPEPMPAWKQPLYRQEPVSTRRGIGGLRIGRHERVERKESKSSPVSKEQVLKRAAPVFKPKRGFGDVDRDFLYADKHSPPFSRIVNTFRTHVVRKRRVELYQTEFSDNTQFYGILDSSDVLLKRMEIREPYATDECVPMKEWQTAYYPSCNGMHELDLERMEEEGSSLKLFGKKGFWRNAWRLDLLSDKHAASERETVVLKTLKYHHNFEDAHFEHDRVDAMAMERLTASPHVINIYGFCGHSVITEYADGLRLGTLADKSKKTPLKRLEIARDIASGLADVHGIDGDGNATFVHLDINPANVVVIGKSLKLNDFNIGIMLKWNTTSNTQCGFPAQYPNPQWRSPEEANESQHLTEKVDVFSMGHIFFRLICGHEPWNKLEVGGRPSPEEVTRKVKAGLLPHIPHEILHSKDQEIVAIRRAMLHCYAVDPKKRPSARDVAKYLDKELRKLKQQFASKSESESASASSE